MVRNTPFSRKEEICLTIICPKCGDPDEPVIHAIFECPPTVQAFGLAATPSHPNIFCGSSIYTNKDYRFGRRIVLKIHKWTKTLIHG